MMRHGFIASDRGFVEKRRTHKSDVSRHTDRKDTRGVNRLSRSADKADSNADAESSTLTSPRPEPRIIASTADCLCPTVLLFRRESLVLFGALCLGKVAEEA